MVKWSDDDRKLAFELYFTEAGRNLIRLQEIISTYPYDRPVPYRTLYHWRQTAQWDVEADKRLSLVAPNIRQRTAGNLIVAALGMSAYLAQVASGAIPPNKVMIAAAKITLDAAGFSPVGSNKPMLPDPPALDDATTPTTPPNTPDGTSPNGTVPGSAPIRLSHDQLLERERIRRQRRTHRE